MKNKSMHLPISSIAIVQYRSKGFIHNGDHICSFILNLHKSVFLYFDV